MTIIPWIKIPRDLLRTITDIYGEALKETPVTVGIAPKWEPLWEYAKERPRSLIMQAKEDTPYFICIWSA
jgi:hypothetical protein